MDNRNTFYLVVAFTLVSAFALSACGIRGELKTPPPLWGETTEKPVEKQTGKQESNN